MFTLQTSFKSLLLKCGGGGVEYNPLVHVEVTVNSKEENSKTSVPITSENSASGYIHILLRVNRIIRLFSC
jgi:hypothetical protein